MKLDLGAGKNCKEGFEGIDKLAFNQKYVGDVVQILKGFEAESIEEAYSRYLLPCLTKAEINVLLNELHRTLKPNAICTLILPAWNAAGGYGHPHFQTEIKEGFFYFLNKEWREANAPEVTELTCDFDATWGYNMHPTLITRNQEYQQFALSNYCNSALDLMVTLKKKEVKLESP